VFHSNRFLILFLILVVLLMPAFLSASGDIRVLDSQGAVVPGAQVVVRSAQGMPVGRATTGQDGLAVFEELPAGSFAVEITAPGFDAQVATWRAPQSLQVQLAPAGVRTRVNVTALRGSVENEEASAQLVNVRDRASILAGSRPTLGNALESLPGVFVQQSTYAQVSPFLRGLTGYHVLNLIDGVRFNNSTFRSGPNQYLAFVEPSQAHQMEVALGPAGAQYGSDALGGAIHVLTPSPPFSGGGWERHGEIQFSGASADRSGTAGGRFSASGERALFLLGAAGRRHDDLRPGGGFDSRNVFTRLFGLDAEQSGQLLGSRMPGTGFSMYGAYSRAAFRLPQQQSLSFWYQNSTTQDVQGYKDLLGGLGRLRSDFTPQSLHFAYGRYEKLAAWVFDSVTATVSLNSQNDGSIRQGLRSTDPLIEDRVRVNVWGYSGQATTHVGTRQAIAFGADVFDERIGATRLQAGRAARPLYPDNSGYRTAGLFAQDAIELIPGRLRVMAGGRFTMVRYSNPESAALGVAESRQSFRDLTFQTSALLRVAEPVSLHMVVSRGFRAPNLNDLGAIGINDLGYEIPAAEAIPAGALLATSGGEGALSTGRALSKLGPERLYNYEAGFTVQNRRALLRAQVFHVDLLSPIVRRTLLFPAGAVPSSLGGLTVTPLPPTAAQQAQGVVTVATLLDPRSVKAFVNDGHIRYAGVESLLRLHLTSRWSAEASYSFLGGRELNPNRNVRRLPPQHGSLVLRYVPAGRRPWFAISTAMAGAQRRLSGGDLDDERIGASRSRRDIESFFGGALAAPYIREGVFTPTGETLSQIQNRVLPLGATIHGVRVADASSRVPLYTATGGWLTTGVSAGFRWVSG
jgi:hemoglobin/transferrin/lactoferrin receptor protein